MSQQRVETVVNKNKVRIKAALTRLNRHLAEDGQTWPWRGAFTSGG